MKSVFADAFYWIAIARPSDSWGNAAREARDQLGDVELVTTDEVLTEFVNALSKGGSNLRRTTIRMVRAILSSSQVRVILQSRIGFLSGLSHFENRHDKQYSLTDCISMNVMRNENIREVLTGDLHFSQEGFKVLIKM